MKDKAHKELSNIIDNLEKLNRDVNNENLRQIIINAKKWESDLGFMTEPDREKFPKEHEEMLFSALSVAKTIAQDKNFGKSTSEGSYLNQHLSQLNKTFAVLTQRKYNLPVDRPNDVEVEAQIQRYNTFLKPQIDKVKDASPLYKRIFRGGAKFLVAAVVSAVAFGVGALVGAAVGTVMGAVSGPAGSLAGGAIGGVALGLYSAYKYGKYAYEFMDRIMPATTAAPQKFDKQAKSLMNNLRNSQVSLTQDTQNTPIPLVPMRKPP